MNGTRSERLRNALGARFAPARVEVADRSAQHAGHAGSSGAGETHYDVLVVSGRFEGMSRVARSRAAHEAVVAEFGGGLHALSLTLRTPAAAGDRPEPPDGPAA